MVANIRQISENEKQMHEKNFFIMTIKKYFNLEKLASL